LVPWPLQGRKPVGGLFRIRRNQRHRIGDRSNLIGSQHGLVFVDNANEIFPRDVFCRKYGYNPFDFQGLCGIDADHLRVGSAAPKSLENQWRIELDISAEHGFSPELFEYPASNDIFPDKFAGVVHNYASTRSRG